MRAIAMLFNNAAVSRGMNNRMVAAAATGGGGGGGSYTGTSLNKEAGQGGGKTPKEGLISVLKLQRKKC